jgi:tetratricopeptide (TPR) repeat protein
LVYYYLKDFSKAIDEFNLALTKDENLISAITNIGLVEYEKGNIDEAMKSWQKAIALNDQVAEPLFALAVALYAQGETDKGIEMVKKAIELDENLGKLDYLQEKLWGDRILNDAKKLLENPTIQQEGNGEQGTGNREERPVKCSLLGKIRGFESPTI